MMMDMVRRVVYSPKQIAQIEAWIDANYDWARENLLNEAAWIDIRAGIETEREAIITALCGQFRYAEWRKEVFGSEKEIGKLVPRGRVVYD